MANSKNSTTGKLRKALAVCGFEDDTRIFHDNHKHFRRLKLQHGDDIFEASQKNQLQLETKLREIFGDAILGMYFIERPYYAFLGKSFCIRLKL